MESKVFTMIPGSQGSAVVLWCLAALIGFFTALTVYIAMSLNNVSFELTSGGLRIRAPLYGRLIPLAALNVEKAELVDLSKDESRRPSWRRNGIGLPGYGAGWFSLKNREKALLFLTTRSDVVYVPTSEGYSLLLSVKDPQEFVNELKRVSGK